MRRLGAAAAIAALLAALSVVPAAAASPAYRVIASGLHNPRGLTFSADGDTLYVAEAGLGAGTPATGVQEGVGMTGSITAIHDPAEHARAWKFVDGLLSIGSPEGAIGIDGIAARSNGGLYGIMGLSDPGTGQSTGVLGRLLRFGRHGEQRTIADVGTFNWNWSGAHASLSPRDFPDSNPYGITEAYGRSYVVDAGTNTLNEVRDNGSIRVLAFFPDNVLADSTPTCVARGPDGALYIGTLALADSAVRGPSAQVYRVDLRHATGTESSVLSVATVWASGLWPINGCAFGRDGSFYASQMFTGVTMGPNGPEPTGGDVVRIPFRHPSQHISLTGGTLPWAAGVAVDREGNVFAVGGTVFANGFVVEIRRGGHDD